MVLCSLTRKREVLGLLELKTQQLIQISTQKLSKKARMLGFGMCINMQKREK